MGVPVAPSGTFTCFLPHFTATRSSVQNAGLHDLSNMVLPLTLFTPHTCRLRSTVRQHAGLLPLRVQEGLHPGKCIFGGSSGGNSFCFEQFVLWRGGGHTWPPRLPAHVASEAAQSKLVLQPSMLDRVHVGGSPAKKHPHPATLLVLPLVQPCSMAGRAHPACGERMLARWRPGGVIKPLPLWLGWSACSDNVLLA